MVKFTIYPHPAQTQRQMMALVSPFLTKNQHKQHGSEAKCQFSVIIRPRAFFCSQPSPCGSTRRFKQDNTSCDRGLGTSRPRGVCLNKKDAKSWHRAETAAWEVFVKLFPGAHAKLMPAAETRRQIPSNVLYPVTPEAEEVRTATNQPVVSVVRRTFWRKCGDLTNCLI